MNILNSVKSVMLTLLIFLLFSLMLCLWLVPLCLIGFYVPWMMSIIGPVVWVVVGLWLSNQIRKVIIRNRCYHVN